MNSQCALCDTAIHRERQNDDEDDDVDEHQSGWTVFMDIVREHVGMIRTDL
eukprot:SAG22_NODE_4961_length_1121_cov_2.510763_1_plen_51_part_00